MDFLPALLAALPALDRGEEVAGPWRLRRAGALDLSGADECWLEDAEGGDAFGFGAGVAYLVLDAEPVLDADPVPGTDPVPGAAPQHPSVVALLLQHGDTPPVAAGEDGDRIDTDSGVLVLHALPAAGRAALLDRATAARSAGGPAGAEFADGWLMLPDRTAGGPALVMLVDTDGYRVVPVLDADGRPTAALVHR
ncbi:hypothetical protein GCM10010495_69020 [Kitasatospora herbaricolor]|uniref:hypothetical protein n=1 Tax=Kitasatospora herbaricolor TaxID=68217 RepID=UPI00174B1173|nr:hypothetical protein [Kitasatospora herbaricolor]MDQ0306223.1 hypothetical protein [Kitasatospora herbaricolor]GGV41645.1 hypothetical protein GCM10010495_69020 [Kitasatospora herbaricolor]